MKEEGVQVIGVWDDHDFGTNNGGKEFSRKGIYREMFMEFIGEPEDSPRREQKNSGMFQDYIIDQRDIKIHIILLDTRWGYDKETDTRFDND